MYCFPGVCLAIELPIAATRKTPARSRGRAEDLTVIPDRGKAAAWCIPPATALPPHRRRPGSHPRQPLLVPHASDLGSTAVGDAPHARAKRRCRRSPRAPAADVARTRCGAARGEWATLKASGAHPGLRRWEATCTSASTDGCLVQYITDSGTDRSRCSRGSEVCGGLRSSWTMFG